MLIQRARTLFALVLRELEVGQGAGLGSLFWAVLEPVFGIVLLTIIFTIALPSPPLGESFALFYATGLLPLILFQDVTQKMVIAARFSRPLFGFSAIRLCDVLLARFFSTLLVQLLASSVVLFCLGWFEGGFSSADFVGVARAYAALVTLSFGTGYLGCWLAMIWAIWPRVWAVILRPLVFISGIFFLVDEIGDPFRDWLLWSPLAHVIAAVRAGLYSDYHADLASLGYVVSVGAGLALVGVSGIGLNQTKLIDGLV